MKEDKKIFVIMPFVVANERDQSALAEFYTTNIKNAVEKNETLHNIYKVNRSGNEFNMLSNIVMSLREADIVLADLSGAGAPNPNVMYELAIRFSVSRKPVILFREDHKDNRDVFDIGQLHCFRYRLTHLRELEEYIIDRIKNYEISPSEYSSPVLQILGGDFSASQEAQRNEVSLNIMASAASLNVLQMKLAGALHQFFKDNEIDKEHTIPTNLDDFRNWFQDQAGNEPLENLDWDKFVFKFQQLPALANLLVDSSFQDYLPGSVKREVNSKLLDFFITYFGSSQGSYRNAVRVHNIFADLHNTNSLLNAVGLFIAEDSKEKKFPIYETIVQLVKEI